QPGHAVRHPVKDGKGRAHPLYAGGGKTEALPNYALGPRGAGAGNETNRQALPQYGGGATAMKEKKAAVRLFTIADWEKEQDYLRRQHQRRWKLDRVTFFNCYHFVRCQPEDVVYQLDYNPEG